MEQHKFADCYGSEGATEKVLQFVMQLKSIYILLKWTKGMFEHCRKVKTIKKIIAIASFLFQKFVLFTFS